MSKETVLVVDDEPEIRDVIHMYLRNEGYNALEAADGEQALRLLRSDPSVRLVILDIMMPKMDGFLTCMKMREISQVPIIMLSARETDMDKITGLTTGADDYVSKPFNPLELMARVKAQLRRQNYSAQEQAADDIIAIGDLIVDKAKHAVTANGRPVALTPLEFAILALLASRRGQVFGAEKIYEAVWREPFGYTDNTVMVHIRNIREKIEPNPKEPQYIKTVWGVGYKIE
ncbi:response regulator transcription factor [Cohnella nanjingensis]|uniref:Response regulator transcription factor n=1 Tax=Cohnella nanjingensis TaxID=1387779 RepID=A0A7X0RUN5_9BACL|nr:response regulator transcription factor [Cohnella nanjingensis]MBB6673925.1 response regulator transcription factor [Cohnella nanjingensis]